MAAAALVCASGAAASSLGPGVSLERSAETGQVNMIGTDPGVTIERPAGLAADAGPKRTALAFADQLAPRFGIAGGAENLAVSSVADSIAGGETVRLQQQLGSLPVIGAELQVNLDRKGELLSISGEGEPDAPTTTEPQISAAAAADAAIAAVAKNNGVAAADLSASEPELQILDSRILGGPGLERPQLVWQLQVGDRGAVQSIRDFVAVDAAIGFVAVRFPMIESALDRVVCDAGNTASRVPCAAPFNRTEGSAPVGNADIDLAYDYAGDTYNFYKSMGRDSLDNRGLQLISTTDYCDPDEACPYQNAFWNGQQMVYGDTYASADDVVGHELSHGFTDFSSHLFYYYQAGAINESLSDVFGEFVDLTNGKGNDSDAVRWQLGEDLPIGAIRNMADPPQFGDPDRTGSPNYFFDPETGLGYGDSGGVHSNSGVNNKAAYLMTDGGSFNGQSVTGLGVDKVKWIYYVVNNELLGSASDYANLGAALRQACSTLAGSGTAGITSADCAEVNKAVLATEMDLPPAIAAPAVDLPACNDPADRVANVYFEDFENPATMQWGTEAIAGDSPWFHSFDALAQIGFDATYATSGTGNLWGYDQGALSDTAVEMTQSVPVPAAGQLRFAHSYGFETYLGEDYDGGILEYSTDGGASWTDAGPLLTGNSYNGVISPDSNASLAGRSGFVGESGGYLTSRADLSSLAGQSVRFRMRMATDEAGDDFGWFIDDVQIYSCKNSVPPTTTIKKAPKKVKSTKKKAKAKIKFSGADDKTTGAALKFQCKIDKGPFKPCSSPAKLKLKTKRGKGKKHTIAVRAVDSAGNVDATAATVKIRAIRKGGHKKGGRKGGHKKGGHHKGGHHK